MWKIAIVAVGVALAACVQANQSHMPDGRVGHSINCTLGGGWNACYEKAGEICGARGYDVVERIGETGYSSSFNMYGGGGGTHHMRSLIVACKGGK